MKIDKDKLNSLVYDPNAIQKYMLEELSKVGNGEYTITDPNNPFIMLMEMAAMNASQAVNEPLGITRMLYPSIAEDKNELYRHISNDQITNMFSVPAVTPFVIFVNLKDLRSNGYRDEDKGFYETTINTGTEIIVMETTFTILNDINVRLYDNNSVYVEQLISDNSDISNTEQGVLRSGIITTSDTEPWITFETNVKQVKRHVIDRSITSSEGFKLDVEIKDKYYHTDVEYKNGTTGGKYVKLNKTHAEDFINKNTPTVFIQVKDKDIHYKIPDIYFTTQSISGNIKTTIYESKGKIYLPLNKFNNSEFKVDLASDNTNPSKASIVNITVSATCRTVAEGGRDPIDIEEIRHAIVHNSTGDIDTPVTIENIKTKGKFHGFNIYKSLDVVTNRVFIASKNLPEYDNELVNSKPDIFFNTINIIASDLPNTTDVLNGKKFLTIKSGTIFKEDNGKFTILDNNKKSELLAMTKDNKISYMGNNRFFWTPYYYVLDKTDLDTIETRVYNLDKPTLKNVRIMSKNINVAPSVNTEAYAIDKTNAGYMFRFKVIGNEAFNSLDKNKLKAQVSLPLVGVNNKIYFKSDYNIPTQMFTVHINTNLYIDENNYIEITNGVTDVNNKLVNLNTEIEIHLYTTDNLVVDNSNFLSNEVKFNELHKVVLDEEKLSVEFGKKIDYIWKKLFNTFTNRKYIRYDRNIIKKYTEDVYEVYSNGTIFKTVNGELVSNKLHNKGDTVLDNFGKPVILHNKGDIILNNEGYPTLDTEAGVSRFLDVMMIELEYKLATSPYYSKFLEVNLDIVNNWVFTVMGNLNNDLLEQTKVLYKSYKRSENVLVRVNNTNVSIPYHISPVVTLYTHRSDFTEVETQKMFRQVSRIIDEYLDRDIVSVIDMKKEIEKVLGNSIRGARIEGIEPTNNSEMFSYVDKDKRLVLKKKLALDANNELIVNYDIKMLIDTL